jgi:two-component system, NtrC family, response regulator
MARVLIIDDDNMFCEMLSVNIKRFGHKVKFAQTLKEGLKLGESDRFDVVFLDVRMPDGNGIEIIPQIREMSCAPEVIIITGLGDPDGAELAIRNGAWDYINKNSSANAMLLPLIRALEFRKEKQAASTPIALQRDSILGNSPKMKACLDLIAQAAKSNSPLIITGETGTGKELFARVAHENSQRKGHDFVVVDCAALPETLAESLLFGHMKGAFTGADRDRDGLIKQADGGTLFLDEVGELPISLQKKFLRVLQERVFRPLGSNTENKSNFRLIAATNRDLDLMTDKGHFRKDLLFRLRTITVELPTLRDRKEDLKELAVHYINNISENIGKMSKGFSPEFFDAIFAYDWPGNVREFFNSLDMALVASKFENTLYPQHLPKMIRIQITRALIGQQTTSSLSMDSLDVTPSKLPSIGVIRETVLKNAEHTYLKDLMAVTEWNMAEACRISGLSRPRLYGVLKKHNIKK